MNTLQEKDITSASTLLQYLLQKPELQDNITNLFLEKVIYS